MTELVEMVQYLRQVSQSVRRRVLRLWHQISTNSRSTILVCIIPANQFSIPSLAAKFQQIKSKFEVVPRDHSKHHGRRPTETTACQFHTPMPDSSLRIIVLLITRHPVGFLLLKKKNSRHQRDCHLLGLRKSTRLSAAQCLTSRRFFTAQIYAMGAMHGQGRHNASRPQSSIRQQ